MASKIEPAESSAVTPERLAEIRERAEKAHRHIADICAGKARWKMTIPANPGTDSDLIFSNALNDVDVLLAALDQYEQAISWETNCPSCSNLVTGLAALDAEVERVTRELAEARAELEIAEKHIERGNDETMRAWTQVRTREAQIEQLTAELVAGHDGCEAELQQMALRDEWRDLERMRPVVKAAKALREAESASPYLGAPPEIVELIAAVDAYDDYAGDIPGRCTRCGGLDGTHTIRNCDGNAAALSPADVPAQTTEINNE
jgi:hypothetical protein